MHPLYGLIYLRSRDGVPVLALTPSRSPSPRAWLVRPTIDICIFRHQHMTQLWVPTLESNEFKENSIECVQSNSPIQIRCYIQQHFNSSFTSLVGNLLAKDGRKRRALVPTKTELGIFLCEEYGKCPTYPRYALPGSKNVLHITPISVLNTQSGITNMYPRSDFKPSFSFKNWASSLL